jgi:hypothetical protein
MNLARAGCTPPEIAAVTGHKIDAVLDILETYLPRNSEMAAQAITKLDAYRRRKQEQKLEQPP